MAELKRDGKPLGLPPRPLLSYMIDALFEAGPTTTSSMGDSLSLDWPTVWAYAQATGALVEPWEFRVIMQLSREYLTAKVEGQEAANVAPVDQESVGAKHDRELVDKQLRAAMDSLVRRQKQLKKKR